MKLNNIKKVLLLSELQSELNLKDKILLILLKKYTYKIYVKGIKKGYDWDC